MPADLRTRLKELVREWRKLSGSEEGVTRFRWLIAPFGSRHLCTDAGREVGAGLKECADQLAALLDDDAGLTESRAFRDVSVGRAALLDETDESYSCHSGSVCGEACKRGVCHDGCKPRPLPLGHPYDSSDEWDGCAYMRPRSAHEPK